MLSGLSGGFLLLSRFAASASFRPYIEAMGISRECKNLSRAAFVTF